MSGKNYCFFNAMVETVIKTIKNELVWGTIFQIRAAEETALGLSIDGFDNLRRQQSALGYKLPVSFEVETAVTE